jgi:hypothetical protein
MQPPSRPARTGGPGLQVQQGYGLPELNPAELAQAEVRRLAERRQALPGLMRDAAKRGAFDLVADLRIELQQLPLRLWAAEYTAVHAAIEAAPPGRDRADLEHRARGLMLEIRPDQAMSTLRPAGMR